MPKTYIDPNTYQFTFGKYKGKMFFEVWELDAKYLEWAEQNIKWFNIPKDEVNGIRADIGNSESEFYMDNYHDFEDF